jgi:hypothetical protein
MPEQDKSEPDDREPDDEFEREEETRSANEDEPEELGGFPTEPAA